MRYALILTFFLFVSAYSISQTISDHIVQVKGDLTELRIKVYNYGDGTDTTHLNYIKLGEENILTRYGSVSDHFRTIYNYNMDTQEHFETLVRADDSQISDSVPLTQKTNHIDHVVKNEQGLDSVQCMDTNCESKITIFYHPNLMKKEVIEESNGQEPKEKYKKVMRFDTLGNKCYEEKYLNDTLTSGFTAFYVQGTNLITTKYCINYSLNEGEIDTINFSYLFDKSNWISRKRFVNGKLNEEVERRIFYESDALNLSSQTFKPIFECYTHGNIELDLSKYTIIYKCKTNRIECVRKNGKVKWSLKTSEITNSHVEVIRESHKEKYDVMISFADQTLILLNSKNGKFKIEK